MSEQQRRSGKDTELRQRGTDCSMLGQCLSVAEAAERHRWLSSFPELSPNPILEVDQASGALLYLNPAVRRLFPDLEEMGIRHSFLGGWEVVQEELLRRPGQTVLREMTAGDTVFLLEFTGIPGAGRVRVYATDITHRKRAEQALQESEARLAGIVNSAMDAIVSVNAQHRIVLFNPAAERMFGYPASAVIGLPLACLLPERFSASHERQVEKFERDGKTTRKMGGLGEVVGLRASGEEFPVEASISQGEAGGGQVLTVILRDITERKQGERERERSLMRLHQLIDVSRDVLAANSKQELMEKVVEAARKITGAHLGVCGYGLRDGALEMGAIAGMGQARSCSPTERFLVEGGGVHLELLRDRNTIRCAGPEFEGGSDWWGLPAGQAPPRGLLGARLLGRHSRTGGIILVSDKAGSDFTAEDEALLGQLAALCSVGLHHLEAKEHAEVRAEELAAMVGAMADGVIFFNADGIPVEANRAAVEMLGFNPINQLPDQYTRRLGFTYPDGKPVPPDRLPSRRALRGRVIQGDRINYTRADGRRYLISVSAAPVRTRRRIIGAVVVWHDQTEREILLQEVAAARDKLELRVEERTAELAHTVAALKESEARFRSMFEEHQAIMLLTDPVSGQVVDANPAACDFYGSTREQLRHSTLRDLGIPVPGTRGMKRSARWTQSPERQEATTSLAKGGARTVEVYATVISLQRRRLVFSIMHDITERKILERQIVEISESERQRIGRDLHDSLGGHLTGLALLTRALAQSLARVQEPVVSDIDEIVEGINAAIGLTREISHGLCPVDSGERGLITGLCEFVAIVRRRAGVDCRFRAEGDVRIRDAVVSSHLFRIVEEAVQNALRHAQPKRIDVRLRRTRAGVLLTVRNDGRSLPANLAAARGLGLRTMGYRADMIGARLELRRIKGGTAVSCLLPARPGLASGTPARSTRQNQTGRRRAVPRRTP